MKKLFTLILLVTIGTFTNAQITITNSDMPSGGDTNRFSLAAPTTAVDLTLTGPNYTWDFSGLQSTSQDIDTFLSVTSTPLVYLLVFGFNSNLASRGIDLAAVQALPVSDVYNFYNKSANNFKQKGFGATISGITTPISYINDDVIYDFPVNFGNQDSSDSNYSLIIPGLASAIGSQHRVNVVDGWGSITTPYGTFNALRVVSTLTGEDSVYLDTLGFGFSAARPLTREYKWLANGMDIPVLQINTSDLLGNEVISSIKYPDSLRVAVGLDAPVSLLNTVGVYPNPGSGSSVNAFFNLTKSTAVQLNIISVDGRLLNTRTIDLPSGQQTISVRPAGLQLNAGVYFVNFVVGDESRTVRMVVQP